MLTVFKSKRSISYSVYIEWLSRNGHLYKKTKSAQLRLSTEYYKDFTREKLMIECAYPLLSLQPKLIRFLKKTLRNT